MDNLVFCFCIFTVHNIVNASLRRHRPEFIINWNTANAEPGFELNEEDMTKFHIWPTGTIPYYIDDFSYDKVLRDRIRMFLDGVNHLTRLHFVEIPRPPEDKKTRWVFFINRKGVLDCADHPFHSFTNEGVQKVVLGYHCLNSDENLADVVLSLVGVPPQHNSPDRDNVVEIKKNNILPDKLYLFKKMNYNEWLFHDLLYDIESAGHYGPYKYTSNGNITVQQLHHDYFHRVLGPPPPKPKERGFSSNDILKIAMLYNYIVRNRETPVPECNKLFAPGNKLSASLVNDKNHVIKPRKKPSQYLGISEKGQLSDDSKIYNDQNMTDNNEKHGNKNNFYSDNDNNENDSEESGKALYASNELSNGTEHDENIDRDYEDNYCNNEDNYCIGNKDYSEDYNNDKDKDYNVDKDNYEDEDNNVNKENNEDEDNNVDKDNNEDEDNNKDYDIDKVHDNEEDDNNNVDYSFNKIQESDYESSEYKNNTEKNNYNDGKYDSTGAEIFKKDNKIEDENKLNGSSKVTEYVTSVYSIINTTRKKRMALKIDQSKKHTLLGQSDYETGDEGKEKYIHEKTL